MSILHIDFETYSRADLKAVGLDNYARHPSTGVHCMGFAFDDEPVDLWAWGPRSEIGRVHTHVRAGGLVYAHNAAFEWALWNFVMVPRFGWPELRIERVR